VASNTTLNTSGSEVVSSGGTDYYTWVNSGGSLLVASGGVINNDTLNGASLIISTGVVANNIVVSTGGAEVFTAGVLSGTDSLNGGTGVISISGSASNTAVYSGGTEIILNGGVISANTINSGGIETVASGGIDSGSTLQQGGVETVLSGGTAIDSFTYYSTIQINGGTELAISGHTARAVTVNNGGNEYVASAGTAQYTTINSGGSETVSSGGAAQYTIINSGGTEYVASGGVESGVTVNSGGSLLVASGGGVNNATINGVWTISAGAVAHNTTINNGGTETVLSGGITSGNSVYGTEVISSGGIDSGSTIQQSGIETVLSGGTAINTYSNDGGVQINGGQELVTSGYSTYYIALNNSGSETISAGGQANYTAINSGSSEFVSNGGITTNSIVYNGGSEVISSGGQDNVTTVSSGGSEIILNGGIAHNTTVTSGGSEVIYSGGELMISAGSNPSNGLILNGGAIIDLIGIAATAATVNSANQLVVTSGNTVVDTLGLLGNNSNDQFITQSDGNGGTDILVKSLTSVSTAGYNAATGQLSLTGSNLTTTAASFQINDFSLKGDGGASYTLSSGSSVLGTPTTTNVLIQLSTADQLAVDGLLNNNGTKADDGLTVYNLSAIGGWDAGANAITTLGVNVSNVNTPSISTVTYNAASGVFTVTGANLDNHGSSNGIALTDFKLSGGGSNYSFNAGNDIVSNLSASGFTITLNSNDKASVNAIVTDNGLAPSSGAAYNLSAIANWDSDSGAAITTQAVSVNNVLPGITSATYNVATGQLSLTGHNFTAATSSYFVNDLSLTGDGGGSYTLSSGSSVIAVPSTTSLTLQLSAADQLALDGLFNHNGVTANDGLSAYKLSATTGWDTSANASNGIAVTVSNATVPAISTVNYNAATGVFTISGSNLVNHGSSNGITLGDFKLSGGVSSNYLFNGNDSISNLTAGGFNITLSSADHTSVNTFVTANGTAPLNGAPYNFTATSLWDSDNGAPVSSQAVTVNSLPPVVTGVSYNAATGLLNLSGNNFNTSAGAYTVNDLSLTGDSGGSYTLSSTDTFSNFSASGISIQLSTADQLAVDGLLNKNGSTANDRVTAYNLSAGSGWETGAAAITSAGVTVSNVVAPAISTVSYNAASGVFSISGSNLVNHGSLNGITLNDLKFSGGAGSYNFIAANDSVSNLSSNGFTLTLSSSDKTLVNSFVTDNGTAPNSSAAYNLSATSSWDSDSGSAITSQAVSVNGLSPSLSNVSYNAVNGQLSLSGHNLSSTAGAYILTDLSLSGDDHSSYTLSSGSSVTSAGSTAVTIQLSAADQLAMDGLLNKNGGLANDGASAYSLAAAGGWTTNGTAISNQSLSVSNVTAPSISAVSYNAASGVFTVSGSNLDNHGSSNGITLGDFKLTGGGSGSYSFSVTNDSVNNLSATGFSISLSPADRATVNGFVTDNGIAPSSGAAYNFSTSALWDSDSGAVIGNQPVSVSGLLPAISSVSYNASTGQLSLSGHNFTNSGYNVADFNLTGDGGTSYTLSSADTLVGTPTGTAAVIQLSSTDQLAIDGLLNKNGTTANDGKTAYNLSAGSGWDTGAGTAATTTVTVNNVTAPTLSTVSYNAATGVFTVTGSNLDNHGSSNGITVSDFKLSGGVNGNYSFNSNDTISNLTATGFTLSLSSSDKTTVNAFVNANGSAPSSGAAYNFSAGTNWDSDSGAAITSKAVTVSGVGAQQLFATALYPANIVADSAGDVFVNDFNGIDEIAAGSKTVTNLTAAANLGFDALSTPLAVDGLGNVYAGVNEILANGNLVTYGVAEIAAGSHAITVSQPLAAAVLALATDSAGDVFVAEANNTVLEIAAGNNQQSVLADIGNGLVVPTGLTVDSHNDVYIGEANGNIAETTIGSHILTTVLSGTPQSGGLFYAGGSLGVDSNGDVYFLSGSTAKGWAVGEIAAGTHTVSTAAGFIPSSPAFLPKGVTVDGAGNVYITDYINGNIQEIATTSVSTAVKTQTGSAYLFNTQPINGHPVSINNLIAGSGQIELSKSVYTAFAGDSSVTAANFSNAAAATSATDYLYYNSHTGGLYYDVHGSSSPSAAVEIAVVGVSSHPADLTLADFKLVA